MDLWRDLLTSWVGLLSFGVILFMIGMTAYFYFFFREKMAEDERRAREND